MKQQFALKAAALALGAVILLNVNTKAQSALTVSKDVTLNLDLRNIVEFVVNKNTSTIVFDTYDKYVNGTNTPEADQLSVSSNKAFDMAVKAASATFDEAGNTQTIPAADVSVEVTAGGGTKAAAQSLSTSNKDILTNAPAVLGEKYSIKYSATGGNDFLVKAGTYTNILTYTVTQQ